MKNFYFSHSIPSLLWVALVVLGPHILVSPTGALTTTFFRRVGRNLRHGNTAAAVVAESAAAAAASTSSTRALLPTVHRVFVVTNSSEVCTESCCTQQFPLPLQDQCPVCESCTSASPLAFLPVSLQIIMIVGLLSISAVFSGLTLGVMGLDTTGLEIVMESDNPTNAAYARRIYPLRKKGNQLLCTLLLGNTAANALLSILVADRFGGVAGVVSSTFLILVFAEIIPQAVCTRYALFIGSRAVPLVRVIMVIFFPIAFPLAFALDRVLGKELATTYSGNEMLKLLQIHVEENIIDHETANTMTGALKYKNVAVRDVMTPVANVFMLETDEKLNFETIAVIFKTGYSRVPVYEVNKNNVVGLLFVKDLIFVDPEDGTRVSDFIEIFGRGVHVVWPDDKLGDVLRELKQGRSHMALVRDVNQEDEMQDPFYEVAGIITLEDIIEEILGHEIVDETDAFLDGTHAVKIDREDAFKFARLRLLDSKIVDERLSFDEARAVTAHLCKNYHGVFSLLTDNQMHRMIAETPISVLPTAGQEIDLSLPSDLLYTKDVPVDFCTLILTGKVTVLVGADQFRSDVSNWCLLGAKALEKRDYAPDFSAFVSSGPCRCIRITRARFTAAVDASALERTQQHSSSQSSHHSDPAIPGHSNIAAIDSGEAPLSRKNKLLTALRAIDKDGKRNDDDAKARTSSVIFAEPGTLKSINVRARSLLSSVQRNSVVAPPDVGPSRFEFIGKPKSVELTESEK